MYAHCHCHVYVYDYLNIWQYSHLNTTEYDRESKISLLFAFVLVLVLIVDEVIVLEDHQHLPWFILIRAVVMKMILTGTNWRFGFNIPSLREIDRLG